jgi:Eukaryotic phosphomannomutase
VRDVKRLVWTLTAGASIVPVVGNLFVLFERSCLLYFIIIIVIILSGSDLPKQEEQLGEGIAKVFPWNFSQNGLVAYKNGELLEVQTMAKHIGEDNVKRIVNWTLAYISKLDIPIKVRRVQKKWMVYALASFVFPRNASSLDRIQSIELSSIGKKSRIDQSIELWMSLWIRDLVVHALTHSYLTLVCGQRNTIARNFF